MLMLSLQMTNSPLLITLVSAPPLLSIPFTAITCLTQDALMIRPSFSTFALRKPPRISMPLFFLELLPSCQGNFLNKWETANPSLAAQVTKNTFSYKVFWASGFHRQKVVYRVWGKCLSSASNRCKTSETKTTGKTSLLPVPRTWQILLPLLPMPRLASWLPPGLPFVYNCHPWKSIQCSPQPDFSHPSL